MSDPDLTIKHEDVKPPKPVTVTLDLGTFEAVSRDVRIGMLYVNGVPFHVEAYPVNEDGDDRDAAGERQFTELERLRDYENEERFQTVEWDGRHWILVIHPFPH